MSYSHYTFPVQWLSPYHPNFLPRCLYLVARVGHGLQVPMNNLILGLFITHPTEMHISKRNNNFLVAKAHFNHSLLKLHLNHFSCTNG